MLRFVSSLVLFSVLCLSGYKVRATDEKDVLTLFNCTTKAHESAFTVDSLTVDKTEYGKANFSSAECNVQNADRETIQLNYHSTELNGTLQFEFDQNTDQKTYYLAQVVLRQTGGVNHTETVFKTTDNTTLKPNSFETAKAGYTCASLSLVLKSEKPNTEDTVKLNLKNVHLAAYVNGTEPTKIVWKQCIVTSEHNGSSVVPLAVGGGLLVIMVVALIIYIVLRNQHK